MNYAWVTDIHLNCVTDQQAAAFAEQIAKTGCDGVFLTGDISEALTLKHHLSILENVLQRPIFFVLGNHDYWNSSILQVRNEMRTMCMRSKFLHYMPLNGVVSLTPKCAVIGHDGWYDAGCGDWKRSNVYMRDWQLIHDYIPVGNNKGGIVGLSKTLANEAVSHIENKLTEAMLTHDNIVVLTHFPPWTAASLHRGQRQDDNSAPWYTSRALGESIESTMRAAPLNKRCIVFAGHTHGRARANVLPNVVCHVGSAEYGQPEIQQIVQL